MLHCPAKSCARLWQRRVRVCAGVRYSGKVNAQTSLKFMMCTCTYTLDCNFLSADCACYHVLYHVPTMRRCCIQTLSQQQSLHDQMHVQSHAVAMCSGIMTGYCGFGEVHIRQTHTACGTTQRLLSRSRGNANVRQALCIAALHQSAPSLPSPTGFSF